MFIINLLQPNRIFFLVPLQGSSKEKLVSYYTGELLRRNGNYTGQGFCSHIKTVIRSDFCNEAKLHRADLKSGESHIE